MNILQHGASGEYRLRASQIEVMDTQRNGHSNIDRLIKIAKNSGISMNFVVSYVRHCS